MLAGVLLHVIEAAAWIDSPVHFARFQPLAQHMRDAVPLVDHFHHVEPSQLAGIERLAAGGGIKCRPIEIDALMIRTRVDHASPEFGEVAVLVIKAVCHCTASETESLETL